MAFMEFVRDIVTETAANTYTESEFAVPTSKTEELAMLIWEIKTQLDRPSIEDGETNTLHAQVTDRSETAIQGIERVGQIILHRRASDAGAISGALSDYLDLRESGGDVQTVKWDPPILYAKSTMFLSLAGIGNSGAKSVRAKVGYTLERVSREEFIEALVD